MTVAPSGAPLPERRLTGSFALPPAAATPLAQQMAARIRADGPVTFATFMEAALYDPALGYYRSGRTTVGREGDFLTSPEVHPLFGYAIAALAAAVWEAMDRPDPFILREAGPGSGALMESLLSWVRSDAAPVAPAFRAALRVELVEPSAAARARQEQRLTPFRDVLRWRERLSDAPSIVGLALANELLDAQPVHRLRRTADGWEELYVDVSAEGRFIDAPGPLSNAALLDRVESQPPGSGRPGQIVEVCPSLGELVTTLARSLRRGLLLLFDYGWPRDRLYADWRRQGTLLTFHRHSADDDPYARMGQQDLSCHVDVDAVREAARAAGMAAYPLRSQAEFLAALGATEEAPVAAAVAGGQRGSEMEAYLARRRAIEALTDPAGLGRIQVMAFARGLTAELPGLGSPERGRGSEGRADG